LLTYLLESGSDRIGGLDFQISASEYVPRTVSSATLEQLMAAAADIEAGRVLPSPLAAALTRGTSIGGARPKVLLADGERGLIAKFASATDVRPVVKAEGVAMELARRVGLDVAPSRVTQVAGKDVLLVERFDRPGGGRRLHIVSALTILGLDEFAGARYGSYALLADHIRRSFTYPAATLRELFSRIVFNILVGNTDDHPRNHAALVNADRSLTLTPAYDICPQPRSGTEANQAMAIGLNGERSSQLATCLAACHIYLLDTTQAKSIIDTQTDVIQTQWDEAADAARLTELERRQLLHREILNEYALRNLVAATDIQLPPLCSRGYPNVRSCRDWRTPCLLAMSGLRIYPQKIAIGSGRSRGAGHRSGLMALSGHRGGSGRAGISTAGIR
jgi:serine/threonine-protein kinase HipA